MRTFTLPDRADHSRLSRRAGGLTISVVLASITSCSTVHQNAPGTQQSQNIQVRYDYNPGSHTVKLLFPNGVSTEDEQNDTTVTSEFHVDVGGAYQLIDKKPHVSWSSAGGRKNNLIIIDHVEKFDKAEITVCYKQREIVRYYFYNR